SVSIIPLITERRQKFMNQVAMSGMNLNYTKAGVASASRRLRKSRNYFLNAIVSEGLRYGVVVSELQRAWSYDLFPTAFAFGNRATTFPRTMRTRLASRVRQLHAGNAALLMNETDDSGQRFKVFVTPDTKILRTDAALGKNSRCLRQHQPSPAYRPATKMDKM